MKKNNYIALIGVVINPIIRRSFQKEFRNTLNLINKKYSFCLASKIKISLGNEFQGLVNYSDDYVLNITNLIKDIKELSKTKILFGIGEGAISTEIDFENSDKINGQAYYNARLAVERLEKIANSENSIAYYRKEKIFDRKLSTLFETKTQIKNITKKSEVEKKTENINKNEYRAVFIGDIINSKSETLPRVKEAIERMIEKANKELKNEILYEFSYIQGDAFYGVIKKNEYVDKVSTFIINELYPFKVRIGIGIGKERFSLKYDNLMLNSEVAYRKAKLNVSILKSNKNTKIRIS